MTHLTRKKGLYFDGLKKWFSVRLEEKLKRLNSPLALKQWWGGAVSRITLIILNSSHHIQIQSPKISTPTFNFSSRQNRV